MRCVDCPHAGGSLKECCNNQWAALGDNILNTIFGIVLVITCPIWIWFI